MEEIDLRELFRMFWDKKLQICLIIAIFIVLGVIYTIGFVTPVYSSATTLLLASSNKKITSAEDSSVIATDVTVNSKLVSTYSELVKSKNILSQVISNLGIDADEDELKKNIKVSAVKDTEIIEIVVTDKDPYKAEKIANEIAKVFIEKMKEFYKIENVQIVDKAEADTVPSNINHPKDIAIFTAIGIIVAVGYILILSMLDTTVKTTEDIEKEYQLVVLATIPLYDENVQKSKKGGKR